MHRAEKGEGFYTLYIIALSPEQQQKWVDVIKQGKKVTTGDVCVGRGGGGVSVYSLTLKPDVSRYTSRK